MEAARRPDPLKKYLLDLPDVSLHIVEAGPADGRPIVLLHGFPEAWFGWHKQITALAGRGYRVIAPDQRGYNLSQKPLGVERYALPRLADDVRDMFDLLALKRAVVAGHDWGGAVAWWFALQYPARVQHLVPLDAPHPRAMAEALRSDWRQRARSGYMLFFQFPWLAERALGAADGWLLVWAMRRSRQRGEFSAAELDRYRRAWSRPGALRAMLNWYRALARYPPELAAVARLEVPITLIWGAHDPFFAPATLARSVDFCSRAETVPFEDSGHWVQHERPGRVSELLARAAATADPVQ